jgi:hypothetical protein
MKLAGFSAGEALPPGHARGPSSPPNAGSGAFTAPSPPAAATPPTRSAA